MEDSQPDYESVRGSTSRVPPAAQAKAQVDSVRPLQSFPRIAYEPSYNPPPNSVYPKLEGPQVTPYGLVPGVGIPVQRMEVTEGAVPGTTCEVTSGRSAQDMAQRITIPPNMSDKRPDPYAAPEFQRGTLGEYAPDRMEDSQYMQVPGDLAYGQSAIPGLEDRAFVPTMYYPRANQYADYSRPQYVQGVGNMSYMPVQMQPGQYYVPKAPTAMKMSQMQDIAPQSKTSPPGYHCQRRENCVSQQPHQLSLSTPSHQHHLQRQTPPIIARDYAYAANFIPTQQPLTLRSVNKGPPGSGKTTSIWCLANELLGPLVQDAVLELNASDDRSVNTIRTDIKLFCRKLVTLPPGRHKIIILDEADSMTEGAQQALRRMMEVHAHTTRFALACNFSSKIIEPIQSRCAVLRYGRLSDKVMLKRLVDICGAENVNYVLDGLEAIIFSSDGDMRQAINNLQSTASGFSIVNAENVFKFCDRPHPVSAKQILEHCINQEIDEAMGVLYKLWESGYNPVDIVSVMFKVAKVLEFGDFEKLEFVKVVWKMICETVD